MSTRGERIEIFKHLHDLLWNGEGFDPTTSRNILLVLLSIRLIEEHSNELGIGEECRYSHLIKTIHDGGNELMVIDSFMKIIQGLRRNIITSPFFINAKIVNGDTLRKLVLKIEELSNEDLHSNDILGELYETVGSGDKSNSEIGQYFTSREICRFVANICINKKSQLYKKVNGERILKKFLDPFGGTGGFAREFIKRGNELGVSEWKDEIYVFDRNKNMIPIILLNLLFATGKIFGSEPGTIKCLDSFRDNIKEGTDKVRFPGIEYDFIFTNPPFGGDSQKDKGFVYTSTTGKGKDKIVSFEVNEDIRSIGIVDNDKVSAAVQLCMALLAPKGICAAVLPQGFFFSSSKAKVELRKKLIEEYKVHMIIDIPQDAFLGTTTKTSVIIFQKGKETDEIVFMNMKEEIKAIADIDQLREKNYSLDAKMYIEREEVEIEGFEMMRLGDLVEIRSGKLLGRDKIKDGPFKVLGGGKVIAFHNEFNENENSIVISRVGNFLIDFLREKFYLTDNGLSLKSTNEEKYKIYYIYLILKINHTIIQNNYNGTAQKVISKTKLEDIKIPVPSIKKQNEIVEILSGWDEIIQDKIKTVKKLEDVVMRYIQFKTPGYSLIKLSEVLRKLPKTKRLAGDGLLDGEYPFLVSSMDKKRYCDEYDYEEEKLIIGGGGNANIHLEEKFAASGDMLIFETANENFLLPYIYYYLLDNMDLLSDRYQGTTIKHINIKNFLDIEIPNVPLEEQQKLLIPFETIRKDKKDIKSLQKIFNEFTDSVIPKI